MPKFQEASLTKGCGPVHTLDTNGSSGAGVFHTCAASANGPTPAAILTRSIMISFPVERYEPKAQGDGGHQYWYLDEADAWELVEIIIKAIMNGRDMANGEA